MSRETFGRIGQSPSASKSNRWLHDAGRSFTMNGEKQATLKNKKDINVSYGILCRYGKLSQLTLVGNK